MKRKEDRKAQQLCRQAAETLDLVLAGESGDDLLVHLRVVTVVPAPDSSQLLVTLYADVPAGSFDCAKFEDRLDLSQGRLRSAVAAAITRRRAPMLIFHVIGPNATGERMA